MSQPAAERFESRLVLTKKKRGYCILTLTLNYNCDFILIVVCFVILPLLLKLNTPFAPILNSVSYK